jgi:hypothetical protein
MTITGALVLQAFIFLFISVVAVFAHTSTVRKTMEKRASIAGWTSLGLSVALFTAAIWTGLAVG